MRETLHIFWVQQETKVYIALATQFDKFLHTFCSPYNFVQASMHPIYSKLLKIKSSCLVFLVLLFPLGCTQDKLHRTEYVYYSDSLSVRKIILKW